MARRNYLVEGLSGAGKSSVYEELIGRGYKAISTDRAWKSHAGPDAGLPGRPIQYDSPLWDEQRALSELERTEPEVLFVCGSSRNRDRFLPYFTEIFNLRIDDDTMRRRLQERTNNEFGKQPEELELMLRLNRSDEKPAGAIDIDATQPLDQVVDKVLRLAKCRAAASDSTRTPWSRRGSVIGQSFVIPESALPIVQAARPRKPIVRGMSDGFLDVLGREAITRLEYAWSGDVLATLLPYLDEQGIDLMRSDPDEAAPTDSQTGEGSVLVLRSDHRERHAARLDPSAFDGAVLRRYYEGFNETAADGVEYAMLDGIAFLRDTLAPLDPAIVAVFVIGKSRAALRDSGATPPSRPEALARVAPRGLSQRMASIPELTHSAPGLVTSRVVRELRPGVWHWQSPHPDWNQEESWPQIVSSYGIKLGDYVVLFDPLSVPDQLRESATAVALTAPYHERDARTLGLPVHTPPADTWEDWVEKYGVDPDRVRGMESEDLAWLRAGEGEGQFHGPGEWPFGITAYAGREDNDLILWLPPVNAIVTGDSLSDFGEGLDIQLGGRKHVTRDDVVQRLRPLLDLPVELVLPAHGEPTDRAALERVLS